MAYSLLGLLGVNMPLLYGEGGVKAFLRLQQEFLRQSDDESIFAWVRKPTLVQADRDAVSYGILAPEPKYFYQCGDIRLIQPKNLDYIPCPPYAVTNKGLQFATRAMAVRPQCADDFILKLTKKSKKRLTALADRVRKDCLYLVSLNCRLTSEVSLAGLPYLTHNSWDMIWHNTSAHVDEVVKFPNAGGLYPSKGSNCLIALIEGPGGVAKRIMTETLGSGFRDLEAWWCDETGERTFMAQLTTNEQNK